MPESRLFASFWEWQLRTENKRARELRASTAGGARGRVLEIGCGPGSNFAHYGPAVTSLTAIDPNPHMRERASKRASALGRAIDVQDGHAEALAFEDGAFDTVVSTWNMCSVTNPSAAMREIKRVLVPGGEYRFIDHVRYRHAFGAFWQDVATPVWSRILGAGCHPNRDIAREVERAGFSEAHITRENLLWPIPPMALLRPHIYGVARA